jgi:hypothetical protein
MVQSAKMHLKAVSLWSGLALGLVLTAGVHPLHARSTPLGNATLGTSTSVGGADGVPSPSGPGVHPGYKLVSFRNAIHANWRFGGFDWLSDGRMVVVIWGNDCSYTTHTPCGTTANGRTYYGDGQLPPDGVGPGWMNLVSNTGGLAGITAADTTRIYSGLWEPLGVTVARSGNPATDTIYVITKTGLLRFIGTGPYTNGVNPIKVVNTCHARRCTDTLGGGLARSFTTNPPMTYTSGSDSTGTGRRWHHFNYGLVRGNDGFLYAGTGTQYDNGSDRYEQGRDRCAVLKMDPNAGTVQVVAGGLRSPNGWGKGPGGDIFFSDIQGNYNAANSISVYRPGRFYGMRCDTLNPFDGRRGVAESFPVVDLNQGGSTGTDIANNPGEITYLTSGPYAGQMLYGDVSFGGIQRVFVEKVNNEWQGAVMLFSGGFRSGVGRLKLGPDGSIYAGGQAGGLAQSSGNWCWGGASGTGALTADKPSGTCNNQYDFFKLVPKDTVVFELLAMRARVNGFELQFTKKVGPSAANPSNYTIATWTNSMGLQSYGGGSQTGYSTSSLSISNVRISSDSTRVFIQLASMPAASVAPAAAPTSTTTPSGNIRVVMVKGTGILSADGSAPWGEPLTAGAAPSRIAAWYTLNYQSSDTAFAPVSLADARLSSPDFRMKDFKVHAGRENLRIETNFESTARITVRDLRGSALATVNAPAGRSVVTFPMAQRARGTYVIEIKTSGRTLARPVALF